jgi:class 3 adenylate cyclase/tetratricopeptide (TPR) repeat protein
MNDSPERKNSQDEFASKLKAARAGRSMEGERRVVTILFCDVTGSTEMAEQLDPEDWAEIMDDAFDFLIAPIYRYEGTVARLMGDAILAFFGAPIAHEDDPQRAVLAGLAILDELQPFCDRVRKEYGLDFGVRVGINTGTVVVGQIGSDLAMEYTAMGDAVNLAARMEQTAEPGTVQISKNTYKRVAPLFNVETLGNVEVKGKREPTQAYRVIGKKAEPGSLRGIEGLSAPLVGRQAELEKLNQILRNLKEGRGGIVCLIGDAGLGKSRLIRELKAVWEEGMEPDQPLPWSEVQGIPYDTTLPYGLFQQLFKQSCGISEDDPPEIMRQKLAAMMDDIPPDLRERAIYVYELILSIEAPSGKPKLAPDTSKLEGEALTREIFEVTQKIMQDLGSNESGVIVFDDLQWADEASVALLIHLFQLVNKSPLLFLCAFRPFRQSPAWMIKTNAETDYPHRYTEIVLDPLSAESNHLLVDNLLEIADLPPKIHELILQKAEGNPFFVEEIVRTLIESDVVVRDESGTRWRAAVKVEDISIPDNLQALLAARIDRLDQDLRQTLQLASVIGRSFYHRVLQWAMEVKASLDEHLTTLERVELILVAAQMPELEYTFRHELTRDVAYQSILRRHRRQFHHRVGEALESLFPDRLEELAPRLGFHFYEGRDDERALKYYTLAGDAAARLYANTEAANHYGRALEVGLRSQASNERIIKLFSSRGRSLELSGHYQEALANYQELEDLGRERSDHSLELAALIPQATVYSIPTVKHDREQGLALADRALALARELNDHRAEARSLWNLMLLENYTGHEPHQAVEYGEQSLAIARKHHLREELAYALHDLVRSYAAVGQSSNASAALEESRALWREMGNLPMLADNLTTTASGLYFSGDFDEALTMAKESLSVSQSIGSLWGQAYSLFMIGEIYLEYGEIEQSIQAFEEGLPLAGRANFTPLEVGNRARLAGIYGFLGDVERGLELASLALAKADELEHFRRPALTALAQVHLYNGDLAEANAALNEAPSELEKDDIYDMLASLTVYFEGEIALANHDYDRVLELMEKTIDSMHAFDLRVYLYDMLHLKGRALNGLGQVNEAREVLMEAQAEAEQLGSRRSLLQILPTRIEIEVQANNMSQVEKLRKNAKENIKFISDHIDKPELRALFLDLPHVQAIISEGPS